MSGHIGRMYSHSITRAGPKGSFFSVHLLSSSLIDIIECVMIVFLPFNVASISTFVLL